MSEYPEIYYTGVYIPLRVSDRKTVKRHPNFGCKRIAIDDGTQCTFRPETKIYHCIMM